MKALIYDFETGGLDYKKHTPLSLGACVVNLDDGNISDMFEHYIRFDNYITEPEAMAVNKIDLSVCRNEGLEPSVIADKMVDMWTKNTCSLIGGHNNPFDERFAAHWLFGIEPHAMDSIFSYRKIDSCTLIRLLMGTDKCPPGASIKQATKFFKIDMSDVKGDFHGALFDAIACAKVLFRFRQLLLTSMKS
jgi:DNA polymerase III epsilon subunit-like protein